jgi:LysM repeat protein
MLVISTIIIGFSYPDPTMATNHDRAEPEPKEVYVVQPGDTMLGIALRHKLTLDEIIEMNPQITDPNFIVVGQEIVISVVELLPITAPPEVVT